MLLSSLGWLLSSRPSLRCTSYSVNVNVAHASYAGRLHEAIGCQETAATNAQQKRPKAHDSHNLIAENTGAAGTPPPTACLRLQYCQLQRNVRRSVRAACMTTQWRAKPNLPAYVRNFAGLEEGLPRIFERLRPAYTAQALHPGTRYGLCRHLHQHISGSMHHKTQLKMLNVKLHVATVECCLAPADCS